MFKILPFVDTLWLIECNPLLCITYTILLSPLLLPIDVIVKMYIFFADLDDSAFNGEVGLVLLKTDRLSNMPKDVVPLRYLYDLPFGYILYWCVMLDLSLPTLSLYKIDVVIRIEKLYGLCEEDEYNKRLIVWDRGSTLLPDSLKTRKGLRTAKSHKYSFKAPRRLGTVEEVWSKMNSSGVYLNL